MKLKLMIKTHETGLRYLCYTKKVGKDYKEYLGSGTYWKKHLKKYGDNISTELIFETTDREKFKKYALKISKKYNIAKDKGWANDRFEQGDGGDTVSNKMWITDGLNDKYILKTESVPKGFRKGRGSKCVFKDSKKQREFSKRCDVVTRGKAIREAWSDRDNNKFGTRVLPDISGDKNPLRNPIHKLTHLKSVRTPEFRKLQSGLIMKKKPWLKQNISSLKK